MNSDQDIFQSFLINKTAEECFLNLIAPFSSKENAVLLSKLLLILKSKRFLNPSPFYFSNSKSSSIENHQWQTYLELLLFIIHVPDKSKISENRRLYCLRIIKQTVSIEFEIRKKSKNKNISFPLGYYQVLFSSFLQIPNFSVSYLNSILKEFFDSFVDLKFYSLTVIRKILQEFDPNQQAKQYKFSSLVESLPWFHWYLSGNELRDRLFSILSKLPPPQKHMNNCLEDEENLTDKEDEQSKNEISSDKWFIDTNNKGKPSETYFYRQLFQNVWLLFLKKTPKEISHLESLTYFLPQNVFPFISNPLSFSEFLLTLYTNDLHISVTIAALCGIFYLLTQTRIGDPDSISTANHFYCQLYKLIQPLTFSLNQNSRFLHLLNTALNSPLLPSRLVCMFVKKCIRTACIISPPASLWLVSFVFNMVRKYHHICIPLIHFPPHLIHNLEVENDPLEYDSQNLFFENKDKLSGLQLSSNSLLQEKGPDNDFNDSSKNYSQDINLSLALPNSLKASLEDISPSMGQQLRMSLWELQLLKNHYLPAIVHMTKFIEIDSLKKAGKTLNLEDFFDLNYGTLMKNTIKRKLIFDDTNKLRKRIPVAISSNHKSITSIKLLDLSHKF